MYKATQLALKKTVCVKILATDVILKEELTLRFRREADTISRLSHPNIVQVIDFGQVEDTGSPYLVMEYVEGRHLGQFIEDEYPIEEARVVRIMSQVLSALAEAHAGGIVHRDLKPANILLTRLQTGEELVKVFDFGIAKILDEPGDDSLTSTGAVFGTPDYMAPEQASGGVIDHRCDIYAAGIMLYRMVANQMPFPSGTPLGTLTRRLTEKPRPPGKLEGVQVSSGLETVVMKALQRDPAGRYASALDMQQDLLSVPTDNVPTVRIADVPRGTSRPKFTARNAARRLGIFWRQLPARARQVALAGFGLLFLLIVILLIATGPGGSAALQGSAFRIEPPAELAAVQDEIDKKRFGEAERALAKSSAKESAWGDVMRAQILLLSKKRNLARGTRYIQRVVRENPTLLANPSVSKALVYTLDTRNAKNAIDFVVEHADPAVVDELVRHSADRRYWLRWNSVAALKKLGKADRVDMVLVYIADLKYAGSCSTRERAARHLGKLKDKRALKPLRQADQRGFLDNICMGDTITNAIRAIQTQVQKN